jgi:hypothetical protein
MKKNSLRKLQLQRETLQQLDASALPHALGGQKPIDTIVRPSDACPIPTGG